MQVFLFSFIWRGPADANLPGLFLMPYSKPAIAIDDQLARLRRKGMIIQDEALARHYLCYISYFRLRGYFKSLAEDADNWKNGFKPGITFEQLINLYNVDREIRLLLSHMLERFEVALRTLLVEQFCDRLGPVWYDEAKNFYRLDWFEHTQRYIIGDLNRSQEHFILRHSEKYGVSEGLPPAWKTFEVVSLGTLSHIYSNIEYSHNKANKKALSRVAEAINANSRDTAKNWMHALTLVRNICAHHGRLYDRRLNIAFKLPTITGPAVHRLKWQFAKIDPHTPYAAVAVLAFAMHRISPGNHFSEKLKSIIARYPSLDYNQLGFTENWETEPLWIQ